MARQTEAHGPDVPAPAYPIESVDNALRLLLMFSDHSTVRIADASRSLGVAASTAHRLMAMLQYHGFVKQDRISRAYSAGAALTDLGLAAVRSIDVRGVARSAIEALAAEVDETVHLGQLDRTEVLFVDSVESTRLVRVGSRVGVRLPAHVTSLGKAMLAALPRERLLELYPSETLPDRTTRSIVKRKVLLRELAHVAELGYAVNDGESESDVAAVGMAILTRTGAPRAAVSISAPRIRWDPHTVERVVPVLRATVTRISEALEPS